MAENVFSASWRQNVKVRISQFVSDISSLNSSVSTNTSNISTLDTTVTNMNEAFTDFKEIVELQGNVLSAATTNVGAESQYRLNVLGDTNITSFGSVASYSKALRFFGTPTITHNGTTMVTSTGANITVTAGDIAYVSSDSSGNAYILHVPAEGTTLDSDLQEIADISKVSGDILYANATPAWARLAKGTDGQILKLASGLPSWADESTSEWTYAASQDASLGTDTAFDFTGIPAGTSEIEIVFELVGLSGTDDYLVQIGDSGGVETTNYDSITTTNSTSGTGTGTTSTSGFIIYSSNASNNMNGILRLYRYDSTGVDWFASFIGERNIHVFGSGTKTLSAELTQVRVTRDGSNTFDNGTLYLRYR